MVLGGPLLLLAVWVVASIPPAAWLALPVLAVVWVVASRRQLGEGWSEGKRRERVRALRQEIAKLEAERLGLNTHRRFRLTPAEFNRELADLEQRLEVANRDLRLIWQQEDGW